MPTSYTTLLGLALPVQGELQGTWGDEVNNYITNYLDASVAGTQTLSTDADVTLTKTTGTALGATSSQYLILNCTGSRAAARNITVPAQSKAYVVINGTTGGFAVTLRGAGPTTGVSIAAGERAVCVWNGSDFVKAASSNGSPGGSTTQVQYNNAGALAGSANLTFDGTSLTLGGNPTLSAGTANGVLYLNGSKVATSGSALTFDGTDLATTGGVRLNNAQYYYGKNAAGSAVRLLGVNAGNVNYVGSIDSGPTEVNYGAATTITAQYWNISGNEGMRLTSTGLGIGTSSPAGKLDSRGAAYLGADSNNSLYVDSTSSLVTIGAAGRSSFSTSALRFLTSDGTAALERARIDSSGNLGLGVTPSAWRSGARAFQSGANKYVALWEQANGSANLSFAAYESGTNTFAYTTTGDSPTLYSQLSGAHKWFTAPSGTAGNAITFTQAMTLDAAGNLGIGTSSPSNKLVVSNAGAQGFEFDPANGIMQVYNRSTSAYGELRPYGSLIRFFTGTSPTETVRLDSSGNLLVGTTSTGADGLGISNIRNLTFAEGSGTSYANLFRQSSSGATVLANGYKWTATASGFASSIGTSWAKTAIGLGVGAGDITFYADPAGTVANGTDVTPTERFRVKSTGQARFLPLAADPSGAADGDVYYNSTTNKLRVRAGGAWVDLH